MNKNIFWHKPFISRQDRELKNNHKSFCIWLTGLPSSGKSTIAHNLEKLLFEMGYYTFVFDGDNVRHGLCKDLSFTREGRKENIRRIAETIKLFLDAGIICISSLVSPHKDDREMARKIIGENEFIEVYVKCPVEICELRDRKGLYKQARSGLIKNYTGVNGVYEEPMMPNLILQTDILTIDECVSQVLDLVISKGLLSSKCLKT